jgi:hypothetical protein
MTKTMKMMKHEEFKALPRSSDCHPAVMKIGVPYTDGAAYTNRKNERIGFTLTKLNEEDIKLEQIRIVDVP